MASTTGHQSRVRRGLTVVGLGGLCVAMGMALGSLAHDVLMRTANNGHLERITQSVIERAERATDYAIMAAHEGSEVNRQTCATNGALATIVNRSGTVKNIELFDLAGQRVCSAFPDFTHSDTVSVPAFSGVAATNSALRFRAAMANEHPFLIVAWQVETEGTIVVVSDLDGLLFDMLPSDVRDHAEANLTIEQGMAVARFTGRDGPTDQPVTHEATSERYPLTAHIAISRAAFEQWGRQWAWLGYLVGGLFGALAAFAAVREMNRPADPRKVLLAALSRGEFRPYYQATFDLQSGQIVGCEVLMRQVRADGTIVPPLAFIPQAEATGVIIPMTRAVMKTALAELQPILQTNPAFHVAFNVVAADFASRTFLSEMTQIVRDAGVDKRQIIFELTERQHLLGDTELRTVVQSVRDVGFRMALDDTGTGHNGLSHVQDLGVDIIKIDKRFVDFVEKDDAAHAIVEMLVRLADRLGMATVAEGIETSTQQDLLGKLGVTHGQGYLVGKPVPAYVFLKDYGLATSAMPAKPATGFVGTLVSAA
jgi:c-di-GMP phosphodiesterase